MGRWVNGKMGAYMRSADGLNGLRCFCCIILDVFTILIYCIFSVFYLSLLPCVHGSVGGRLDVAAAALAVAHALVDLRRGMS